MQLKKISAYSWGVKAAACTYFKFALIKSIIQVSIQIFAKILAISKYCPI